jgi:hypothetical protein
MLKTAAKARPAPDAAPVYPDDLEPALQDTLAVLANIDAHYDEERERLGLWSGPDSTKERLSRELEDAHREERAPHVQRLAELHRRWTTEVLYRQTLH